MTITSPLVICRHNRYSDERGCWTRVVGVLTRVRTPNEPEFLLGLHDSRSVGRESRNPTAEESIVDGGFNLVPVTVEQTRGRELARIEGRHFLKPRAESLDITLCLAVPGRSREGQRLNFLEARVQRGEVMVQEKERNCVVNRDKRPDRLIRSLRSHTGYFFKLSKYSQRISGAL
jgi:hypothetical protein